MVFTLISLRGVMDISDETKKKLTIENNFSDEELRKKFSGILFLECNKIKTYLGKKGITNSYSMSLRILFAHGEKINNELYFFEEFNKKEISKSRVSKVQNWIDQYDNKNTILLILVCNKNNLNLKTKNATLVYATKEITGDILNEDLDEKGLRIILPNT